MALKYCPKCKKDLDESLFIGIKKKIVKTCQPCRDMTQKWKKGNKTRILLYNQCKKDGGDWDELKEDAGIKDNVITPYPSDAIPCGYCNTTHDESEFNKDHANPNQKRRGCRYYCKQFDKDNRLKNKEYKQEKSKCKYCEKEIKRSWMSEHLKICDLNPSKEDQTKFCELCKITFKTFKTYDAHLKTQGHLRKENWENSKNLVIMEPKLFNQVFEKLRTYGLSTCQQFICFSCITKFNDQKDLTAHQCQKTELTDTACKECNLSFRDSWDKKRHVKTHHFPTLLICPLCQLELTERKWKETHAKSCLMKLLQKEYPGKSQYEQWTFKFLGENGIKFEREKTFPDLKNKGLLPYDFFLNELKIILEIHGRQHYDETNRKNAETKFKETTLHGEIKRNYASKNNLSLLEIDCRPINSYMALANILAEQLNIKYKPSDNPNDFYLNSEIIEKFGELLGLSNEHLEIKKIVPKIMPKNLDLSKESPKPIPFIKKKPSPLVKENSFVVLDPPKISIIREI